MKPPATSCHATALPDAVGTGTAPVWVHLLPSGTFTGSDGRGPYQVDATTVIAASQARMPVDENHSTDHALSTGQPSPAMGWIVGLEAREDGIWGRVEWTPAGAQLMAHKAYRFLSPVFQHDKAGRVLALLRAGLTNTPNFTLTSLHHTGAAMDLIARLRQALGLPDTADEAAVLGAATAAQSAVAAHASTLGRIATAAGAPADAAPDAIVTALQARGDAAGEVARMAGELVTMQATLTTLRQAGARTAATAAIDAALRAGKPIPATIREHYIARHMADPAAVQKELDAMPSLGAGGLTAAQMAVVPADGMSGTDAEVARMMGVSADALKAGRAARHAAQPETGMGA